MSYLKLKDESGMAMLVVLIVTILGSILAGSYMTIVVSESRNSVWQKQRAQSLFLAEAGLEKGLYYLNNRYDLDNPWTDENGQMLNTSLEYVGYDIDDPNTSSMESYKIKLFDQSDKLWLPVNSYLIKSEGIIRQANSNSKTEHRVSCIAARLDGLPIPAALGIMDATDPEDELLKFNSSQWTINGQDLDGIGGLPGIAVANAGDNLAGQLGSRLDQVTGSDEYGNLLVGADAILEDPSMSTDLDSYVEYFRKIAIDISGLGTIPSSFLGTDGEFQILYADLSLGSIKIAGNDRGFGVLVLEGNGVFEMAGNAEWNGVIICAGDSYISLKGGGTTPAHINGALLISNGTVEVNGTADIRYSSGSMTEVNSQLVLYQVYAWSGGWGKSLASKE